MQKISAILLIFALASCGQIINPITTTPAALLGAYDKINKRDTWLERAEKGDVYSQYELANSYCCNNFEGGTDYAESFKWFCEAAKNGYSKAQVEVGKLYEHRKTFPNFEVKQDLEKAYMWYSFAAKRASSQGVRLKKYLEQELNLEQKTRVKDYINNHPDEAKNSCGR